MTKATLVLLPGSLCDGQLFSPQTAYFSKTRKTQVVDFGEQNTISSMAQAALNQVPGQLALAGLSMGGIVALEMMRIAPQRIAGLALLNTNAWTNLGPQIENRKTQISEILIDGEATLKKIVNDLLPIYFSPSTDSPQLRQIIIEMARLAGPKRLITQWQALNSRSDLSPVLPMVKVPTLVMCGEHDQLCPIATHKSIYDLLDHDIAEFIMLKNCGHISTLEQENLVNEELEKWLTRVDATSQV